LHCPMFFPSRHLVLVDQIYSSQDDGYQADVFPVAVLERCTPVSEVMVLDALPRSAFVALEPASNCPPEYPILRTNRPILPQYSLYQNVYFARSCSIGTVTGGPVTYSLQPESVSMFHEAHTQAKASVSIFCRLYESKGAETFECGCYEYPMRDNGSSLSTLDDIVYDLDKPAVHEYYPMISKSHFSDFLAERSKLMRLLEIWTNWFLSHPI
jgi:hypothetical protein